MNQSDICLSCFSNTGGLNPCPHCGCDRTRMQVNPQHLQPGTILNRNYLIGKALGQGGFGITYLGYDLTAQRVVAIKEYFPNGQVTRQMKYTVVPVDDHARQVLKKGVSLFFKEALTLASFNKHPNIVNVLHFFRENNTAYIVMEYLKGKSLKDYLEMRGGVISFTEAEQILCPIMGALTDLHKTGLLHRDISPDNIYLTADGHAKLLDFGAARFSIGNETQNVASIIKPGYAPLEQYSGGGDQGSWTDIYAMGATFYRCLTGKVPIPASDRAMGKLLPSPRETGANLPEGADRAIMKALNMKPEARYQLMSDFEKDIRQPVQPMSMSMPSASAEIGNTAPVQLHPEVPAPVQNLRPVSPRQPVQPAVSAYPGQNMPPRPVYPVQQNYPQQPAAENLMEDDEEEEEKRSPLRWILPVLLAAAVVYFLVKMG